MEMRQAAVVDERQRVFEHGLGLGREAGDQIGAEDDVGPRRGAARRKSPPHRRGCGAASSASR